MAREYGNPSGPDEGSALPSADDLQRLVYGESTGKDSMSRLLRGISGAVLTLGEEDADIRTAYISFLERIEAQEQPHDIV